MDLLERAFNAADEFDEYGKGLLITYAVNQVLGFKIDYKNIPIHLSEQWNRAGQSHLISRKKAAPWF